MWETYGPPPTHLANIMSKSETTLIIKTRAGSVLELTG